MNGISLILCCYNSAKRLPKTLELIAKQRLDDTVNWELIIVNNNSTDTTAMVASDNWETLGAPTRLKIIEEPKPGLSYAREAGMTAATYDVFLFCDDDNWLDKNYVQTVFEKFEECPNLGALGGWCDAVFEDTEPDWFSEFSGNFAVGKPKNCSGYLDKANEYLYGAGLALSRKAKAALDTRSFVNILSDRKGKQLSSGGDVELIYALKLMGFPVYFDERLHFKHYMPKQRMTWEYLIRLRESMYWSNFVLSIYIDCLNNRPFGGIALIKRFIKAMKYIRQQQRRLKHLNAYKALFLKNQIEKRKLFLSKFNFYLSTRKKLNKLKND